MSLKKKKGGGGYWNNEKNLHFFQKEKQNINMELQVIVVHKNHRRWTIIFLCTVLLSVYPVQDGLWTLQ